MKPPYEINTVILKLVSSISEKIGEVNAIHLHRPSPQLRKLNRVKTIRASLAIEGNTLTEDQITAIIEHKRVIGPEKDIKEVLNAIEIYDRIQEFDPLSLQSFLKAHKILMKGLVEDAGKLRTKGVGIFKGEQGSHIAPPPANLHHLMQELFLYLKEEDDPIIIKSCVAHYEIEFIHPFLDGNGRMGRLWQSLLLLKSYPVFEFLPFETLIRERQQEYYDVLESCDKAGKPTQFIEFMLRTIDESLENLLKLQNRTLSTEERVAYFASIYKDDFFSRKDYLNLFKDISPATASRDLKYGVEENIFTKKGDKRTTEYAINSKK